MENFKKKYKIEAVTWYHTFSKSVQEMITEYTNEGYTIKGITMTEPLRQKLNLATGKEINDFLGYRIDNMDVLDEPEEVGVICYALH